MVQSCFFVYKRMVMFGCFVIVNNQSQSKNDKDAADDVCQRALKKEKLVDAEKQHEAAERHRGNGCVPFFSDR